LHVLALDDGKAWPIGWFDVERSGNSHPTVGADIASNRPFVSLKKFEIACFGDATHLATPRTRVQNRECNRRNAAEPAIGQVIKLK
jgi:hypothetical protein